MHLTLEQNNILWGVCYTYNSLYIKALLNTYTIQMEIIHKHDKINMLH